MTPEDQACLQDLLSWQKQIDASVPDLGVTEELYTEKYLKYRNRKLKIQSRGKPVQFADIDLYTENGNIMVRVSHPEATRHVSLNRFESVLSTTEFASGDMSIDPPFDV